MKYISTRAMHPPTEATQKSFCDILLEGLAPDGGLYLPTHYPKVTTAQLSAWRHLSYSQLAFEVLSLFIDDIPPFELRSLVERTYTPAIFGSAQITPLKLLAPGLYLQALSNGPTLAFKDMAMQLLGQLFEYELGRRGETLNILGATSGDTGSAAQYAMRGKRGVNVFMLSPYGRMSPFQQAQMFSLQDVNVHNLAVQGVFDDCQDIVKAVSADLAFKRRYKIGTVNSINWARLLAQVVYYFAGYFQATTGNDQQVSFAVPSGNFGNICAGHIARMMGLPIKHLVLATNENRVLDEFFRTGIYRVRTSTETFETSSPSMDISKASNFERFIFDVLGHDGVQTFDLFKTKLEQQGQFELPCVLFKNLSSYGFLSGHSTHTDRLRTIAQTHEHYGLMIDPHTADGLKVAQEHIDPHTPMIVLETALPLKFSAMLQAAIGQEPPCPPALKGIEALPKRFTLMPAELEKIKAYVAQHA
jgi:threonine synthase